MAKTVDTVALQTGAVKPTSANQTTSSKATSLIESIVAKPTMPTGTTISPQLQNVATNELMATPGVSGTVAAATPTATTPPTITGATAPTATTTTTILLLIVSSKPDSLHKS